MKIKLDLPPYFCPKCGQFRTAQQTERYIHRCRSYGYKNSGGCLMVDGLVRSCILCETEVLDTDKMLNYYLEEKLAERYSVADHKNNLIY